MITEQQYKQARATILKCMFVDGLNYSETSKVIKDRFNIDYEEVAYRMDEEGF